MRKWILTMLAGFLWNKYAGDRVDSARSARVTPQQ
jgi:hypothetical protein